MSKVTQATRVLAALSRAGDRGLTQGDWLNPGGADGAGRITRVAARVEELRADGLPIVKDGKREGFAVYRLVSTDRKETPCAASDASDDGGGGLFPLPAPTADNDMWRAA